MDLSNLWALQSSACRFRSGICKSTYFHSAMPSLRYSPPLVLVVKAAISALSERPPQQNFAVGSVDSAVGNGDARVGPPANVCPRCTFENHESLAQCEICGAPLQLSKTHQSSAMATEGSRPESPGPLLKRGVTGDEPVETIKFSFRMGGEKTFQDRLRSPRSTKVAIAERASSTSTCSSRHTHDFCHNSPYW